MMRWEPGVGKSTLSYEEAMGVDALRRVEEYCVRVKECGEPVTASRLPLKFGARGTEIGSWIPPAVKAFRWFCVGFGDGEGRILSKPFIAGVDGDVRLVHPEFEVVDEFLADPHASFAGYDGVCCEKMAVFQSQGHDKRVDKPADCFVRLWRSDRVSRQAVEVNFRFVCRWDAEDGSSVRSLACGTTVDVTDAYFAERDGRRKDFERDIVDHRYGNLLRECQLLLEAGAYEALHGSLEVLADDIDVRRGKQVRNEAVTFDALLRPCVQSLRYDRAALPAGRFWFKTPKARRIIPYKVLQVKILLDVLSNAVKHGDGYVVVEKHADSVSFSNRIVGRRSAGSAFESTDSAALLRSSSNTGLRALEDECAGLDIGFRSRVRNGVFTAIVDVVAELDDHDRPSSSCPNNTTTMSSAEEKPPAPPPPIRAPLVSVASSDTTDTSPRLKVADFVWVIIEDQPTICTLWTKFMKKRFDIDLKVACTPPEIANAAALLGYLLLDPSAKLVCVMDENLFEFTSDFVVRPCYGSDVRTRFSSCPPIAAARADKRLFYVGASSSDISDARLDSNIGKHGSTSRMIDVILRDLQAILSPPTPPTPLRPATYAGCDHGPPPSSSGHGLSSSCGGAGVSSDHPTGGLPRVVSSTPLDGDDGGPHDPVPQALPTRLLGSSNDPPPLLLDPPSSAAAADDKSPLSKKSKS